MDELRFIAAVVVFSSVLLLFPQDVHQFQRAALRRDDIFVQSFLVRLEEVLLFCCFLQTWEDVRRWAVERSVCVWNRGRRCIVYAFDSFLTDVGIVAKSDRRVVSDSDSAFLVPPPLTGK